MSATDPAVTAAAEAIDGPGTAYLIQRGHVDIDDVARVVAAARPIIEAEVRERIAADIEAEARQVLTDDGAGQVERAALLDAARIARGQS